MSRRGENIYKRKDGRWEGRYLKYSRFITNGATKWGYVYGRSYGECKAKLQKAKTEAPIFDPFGFTVQDAIESWLKDQMVNDKIRASTYAVYRHLIDRHILPQIGTIQLVDLNKEILNTFLMKKKQSGRLDGKGGLSPNTVKNLLSIISSAMHFSSEQKLIDVNPAKSLRSGIRTYQTAKAFDLSEQHQIEEYIFHRIQTNFNYTGLLLCLYTGIRVGELAALQWRNISFSNRTICVEQTLQRIRHMGTQSGPKTQLLLGPPKSRYSIRTIPLSQKIYDVLSVQYESLESEKRKSDSFLFLQKENKPIEPRIWERLFQKTLKEIGKEIRQLNFHALRHTFATRAIEAGMDIKSLSEILGHSSIEITMRVYVHSFLEQKRIGIARLEQYLTGPVF